MFVILVFKGFLGLLNCAGRCLPDRVPFRLLTPILEALPNAQGQVLGGWSWWFWVEGALLGGGVCRSARQSLRNKGKLVVYRAGDKGS